ncbi:TonB-dependent receptor [Pacificimonas aurantium]|uniref:TonB-dependent receptor n=1 Tax=Pacificimonas aurantium TaxID=1250540 RepID=A0ABS7WH39_9SPHN|nr:TonB-dependent receptor [Pacificimonas aurantium]MBZ6377716.1 TonB-dependent receptor [Pacificimonas aurantium]
MLLVAAASTLFPSLPGAALAQDEIVVTGAPLSPMPGEAALAAVVLDREALVADPSGQLENALRDIPGFQLFRRSDARSANPTSQGATLRGIGGNASSRALVLLDGVPVEDPFAGWIAWPALRPESLATVRAVTGGGGGAFGGGLTGTIELSSAGPGQREDYVHARYGSRDSLDLEGGALVDAGAGFLAADAHFGRGDGFFTTAPADRGAVDTRSPYEQGSIAARGVFPAFAGELQVRFAAFYDERQRGQRLVTSGTDGADASLRYVGRGALPLELLGYVQAREYRATFARTEADRSAEQPALDQYNTPGLGAGGKIEVRPVIGPASLSLGADLRYRKGSTNERYDFDGDTLVSLRRAGGESLVAGAFAGGAFAAGERLTLTAEGRVDRWSLSNGSRTEIDRLPGPEARSDSLFPDRHGWEPSGRVGLAYQPAGAVTLRASAYSSWRLPTLNELYRPYRVGPDATAANEALEPERGYGAEVGVDYRPLSTATLSVTGFRVRAENAIANVTLAEGPGVFPGVGFVFGSYRQRLNLDAVEAWGLEAAGKLRLGGFDLFASYALTDAEVDGSGDTAAQDGFAPPQVPRHRVSLSARADLGPARLGAGLRYTSEQFEDDLEARPLGDALVVDASAELPLRGGLSLTVAAENLLDERVEDGIDVRGATTLAQPRTLWAGLKWTG